MSPPYLPSCPLSCFQNSYYIQGCIDRYLTLIYNYHLLHLCCCVQAHRKPKRQIVCYFISHVLNIGLHNKSLNETNYRNFKDYSKSRPISLFSLFSLFRLFRILRLLNFKTFKFLDLLPFSDF